MKYLFCVTGIEWVGCFQCKCVDPSNLGEPPVSCGEPDYKGDGNCDDDNNNKGCAYDGGDCCYKTVKGGKVKKDYCKQVKWVTESMRYSSPHRRGGS